MADAAMEQAPLPQRNGNANAVKSEPGQADQNVSQNSNNNNQNKNNNRRGGGAGNFRGGRGGGNNRNFGNRNNPNQQNRPNFPNKPGQVGFNNQKKNEDNASQEGGSGNQRMGNDDRKPQYKKGEDFQIMQKLKQLIGPMYDLQPIDQDEIKFSNRNRLYVGNLTNDVTEEELRELFVPFGEIAEAFINKEKNFAFVKVDFHANAEKAKRQLDGTNRKGRQLRVRFAPNATTIRVRNLSPMVSNELLYKAFEIFGPIERAVAIVDDRGKPSGEGHVEFARKASATAAVRYCEERCFFLTTSLRPCVVDLFDQVDDTDGQPEKSVANKKNPEFNQSRSVQPRFAEKGSFEHEYGTRWKQLYEMCKQKKDMLLQELRMEEQKLEAQMEHARYEHETELLREQLRMREQSRDRHKMEWEMREKHAEEQRNRDEEQLRRSTEDMQMKMHRQDEELRRRQQENTLFMQAQQLNSILDQQERKTFNRRDNFDMQAGIGGGNGNGGGAGNGSGNGGGGQINPFNRPPRFNDDGQQQQQTGNMGGVGGGNGGGGGNQHHQGGGGGGPMRGGMQRPWDRRDDNSFQNKRRRF